MKQFRDTNYYVSENGDIFRNGKKLKPNIKKGYCNICLYYGGVKNSHSIHRIVAETYLPNPNNLPEVDHKDTNKLNNSIYNLEWVTTEENKTRAIINGLYRKGINHQQALLTKDMLEYIKNNYKPNDRKFGGMALSRKFNVSHSTISRVINNKTYKYD
jgi:DNA-directed RNA polymerase specialized sigma54-like protein